MIWLGQVHVEYCFRLARASNCGVQYEMEGMMCMHVVVVVVVVATGLREGVCAC